MEGAGMNSRHSGNDLPTRDSEVMPKVYIRARVVAILNSLANRYIAVAIWAGAVLEIAIVVIRLLSFPQRHTKATTS
jgi:hypothetical protein